ncbi:MAG: hypothetical protein IKY97_03125 [Mailhella sp.]|nr:hypothetical protein [Mailhella sp.]
MNGGAARRASGRGGKFGGQVSLPSLSGVLRCQYATACLRRARCGAMMNGGACSRSRYDGLL